jgi:transcriptional regulator NrdR family protein
VIDLKILKRDGTMEDFDRSKLVGGLLKAGATPAEADNVTGQVESWANGLNLEVVSSTDVWKKVIEALKAINPGAGTAYETYRKPAAPSGQPTA